MPYLERTFNENESYVVFEHLLKKSHRLCANFFDIFKKNFLKTKQDIQNYPYIER